MTCTGMETKHQDFKASLAERLDWKCHGRAGGVPVSALPRLCYQHAKTLDEKTTFAGTGLAQSVASPELFQMLPPNIHAGYTPQVAKQATLQNLVVTRHDVLLKHDRGANTQALYVHTCCKCGSKLFFIVEELSIVPSIAFGKSFKVFLSLSNLTHQLHQQASEPSCRWITSWRRSHKLSFCSEACLLQHEHPLWIVDRDVNNIICLS